MHKEKKQQHTDDVSCSKSKSRFPQGKAALILYITEAESKTKQNKNKQPFRHLTSHPLQNYPPQPQGRGCWSDGGEQKKNHLVDRVYQ